MAKRAREQAVREKRERKDAKKAERAAAKLEPDVTVEASDDLEQVEPDENVSLD